MGEDEFGLPESLFGQHDFDFYGVLGRIVAVSALVELQLLQLRQALGELGQWQETTTPASKLVRDARKALRESPAFDGSGLVHAYLTDVKDWLDRRNEYVHGVWPAQTDGTLFGWKPARRACPAKPTEAIVLTRDELLADLTRVSGLASGFGRVAATMSGLAIVRGVGRGKG